MKHFLVKKITQVLSLILNLSASSVPVTPTPPFLVRHGMSLPYTCGQGTAEHWGQS